MTTRPDQPEPPVPTDQMVETQHKVTVGGQLLEYSASAGLLVLREESEKQGEQAGVFEGERPRATVFYTAYTRSDIRDRSTRPITFAFNGGPGSSSVWLHMGLLGPRRVLMDAQGWPLPPPYQLVENAFTLLAESDLVFIDPVSTGYSRAVPGEKANQFHAFQKDIESVGNVIRLYTTRNQRWSSPKFLAGESYGTTRAAGLAGYLQERHGMYLNGLMLISSVLQFNTVLFDYDNDLPFITFLPTYTATAWYHNRLPAPLQRKPLREVLDEVEAFAIGEYATGLLKGARLSEAERARIIRRMAQYTGLMPDYIDRSDLRIRDERFVKELLRTEQRTIGRLDSRLTGVDRDSVGESFEHDPSYSAILGPYTGALHQYLRETLRFESDLPYEILTGKVQPWSYAPHENRYVDVAETLRKAITMNQHLQVFVANGYYDMATPYFATEHSINHIGLPVALRQNLSMGYYDAGHMMYIHQPSLEKLATDLAGFVRKASRLG